MTEPPQTQPDSENFGQLLSWHLLRGTRPGGRKDRAGRKWSKKEFAAAVGVSDRTARFWLRNQHLPREVETIERVLFGRDPSTHAEWRIELRQAHEITSRSGRPDLPRSQTEGIIGNRGQREIIDLVHPLPADPSARATADRDAVASRPGALPLPHKPSIAVLPFVNLSGDPEQEYFADGIAEEIITALSKLRWFFVIARNSTFAYKGQSPDTRLVASELGVHYVLKGSIRKAGNRIRIAAQLIDGASANHIWAERYDREIADIFAVQDDIARCVIAAIEPQLYAAENLRIQSNPPESLDAWGCVIRALSHFGRYTKEDDEQARQLLRQAIRLNPRYAKAHSLLAAVQLRTLVFGVDDVDLALSSARHSAQVAVGLDDDDPWSHFSVGWVEWYSGRHDTALTWFHRAIGLNPNFALALAMAGAALAWSGQPDPALELLERAQRMSPRDQFRAGFMHFAGIAHFVAERYAEGAACEVEALRARANWPPSLRCLAACLACLGQLDEARAAVSELLKLRPEYSIKRAAHGYAVLTRPGDQERLVAALRQAGLPEE
jgi:TolB-like protein/Flp pilus assembly protein TadD